MSRTRRHPALLAASLAAVVLLALALSLLTGPAGPSAFSADAASATARAASAPSDQAFPVGGAEFERARAIAQAHWGAVPCQDKVTYRWVGLEPLTNARATWSNPTSAWTNAAANFDCEVVFNAIAHFDFAMLCTVMAHEVGHLVGRQHDEQPGHLMSAIYTTPLPECADAAPAVASAANDTESDDGIEWNVSEPKAKKAKNSTSKARVSTAKRRRCIVRFRAGRRVKRCVVLKKPAARKARTASRSHD